MINKKAIGFLGLATIIFLGFMLFCVDFFKDSCRGQTMPLEKIMKNTTQELLQAKKTEEIIKKRSKIFRDMKLISKTAQLIMAGFDFDAQAIESKNVYAYLFHDSQKPFYYCLVIDNFGNDYINLDYLTDEYLFKSLDNQYHRPSVEQSDYQNGEVFPKSFAYVDLGFNFVGRDKLDSLLVRIDSGKTLLYLTKIPQD